MRGWEDTVRSLPTRVAPPEVGVTMGRTEAGSGRWGAPLLRVLSYTTEGAVTREAGGRSEDGSEWGDNSITYRRWAGQGAEQGALEAWGCPALPAFADRFARRSCCEVWHGQPEQPGTLRPHWC